VSLRFISLQEGLHLTRSSSSPPPGWPSSSEGNKRRASRARCEREDLAPGIDARNSLRTWWDGVRAQPGPVLRVFDGGGRQYLPGRGGDGEAVETSQVGVGDQPGLPVALLELDRWESPRLAVG
jgi:hypothetical protein